MKKSGLFVALTVCFSGAGAFAAQEDLSALDKLWEDEASHTSRGESTLTTTPSAPMCTLRSFKQSCLVEKGGWPGLGPFQSETTHPDDLVDGGGNRLKMHIANDNVTEAELRLVKEKANVHDFLDLEMSCDFLLEAVGARAKKIAEFNRLLEKSKEAILSKDDFKPLWLSAGRYLVSIERDNTSYGQRLTYVIRVMSGDASEDLIRQHSAIKETEPTGSSGGKSPSAISSVGVPVGIAVSHAIDATADALKEEFLSAVKNWQRVKRTAMRNRESGGLSEVLSGRALAINTDSVKRLSTSHRYWDISPKGVSVDRYSEVVPGVKYQVLAHIKQSKKFVDDVSGQVLKEDEDSDKVNYTVEKIGGRWLITDYAIVSSSAVKEPVKGPSGQVNR
ncbi:MAG: DUF4101 domain-containing protein [Candidatus Melainabacteria bacterium]|nr:DUF4101 domain-containing protein [Candidatus Melainabacteria bacterium]